MFEKINSVLGGFKKGLSSVLKRTGKEKEVKKLIEKNVSKVKESAKAKVLLNNAKKDLKTFYDKKNFKKVLSMIDADVSILTSSEFKAQPENSRILALQAKISGITSSSLTESVLKLNFFDLYKEVKTQEVLFKKFPNHLFDTKTLAKYKELLAKVNTLQASVAEITSKKGLSFAYQAELSKRVSEVKNYSDIVSIL
jgi:hypothetical protein